MSLFKPLLDAFVVIHMPSVAGKFDNFVILIIRNHTYYTFFTLFDKLGEASG